MFREKTILDQNKKEETQSDSALVPFSPTERREIKEKLKVRLIKEEIRTKPGAGKIFNAERRNG